MENAPYLFVAYSVVWAVLFGYVLILVNRQRKLKQELDSLKTSLKDKK